MKIVFARHGLYQSSEWQKSFKDFSPMLCFEPIGSRESALEFLSICADAKPLEVVCVQDDIPLGVWIEVEQAFPPMEVLYVSRGNGRRDWETGNSRQSTVHQVGFWPLNFKPPLGQALGVNAFSLQRISQPMAPTRFPTWQHRRGKARAFLRPNKPMACVKARTHDN